MLKYIMQCVDAFHKKMNLPREADIPISRNERLYEAGVAIRDIGLDLEEFIDEDMCVSRGHLLAEELGEFLMALADGDEVEALDGATDLQYVLSGTARIYDWPMDSAFAEVHKSNMSKTRAADDPGRVRDKGETYVAPDLERVLKIHKSRPTHDGVLREIPQGDEEE